MRARMAMLSMIAVVAAVGMPGAFAEENTVSDKPENLTLGVLVFPGFELLDAMGPLEMFGNVNEIDIVMVAEEAGEVASAQSVKTVADYSFDTCPPLDMLLVPGGRGVLTQMNNDAVIAFLNARAEEAQLTTTVCNGSQLLAAAGLLDGRRATTNKMYYGMITAGRPAVDWVPEARWVDDGDIVTSSGVSAGIDMALHVIARLFGEDRAEAIAKGTEYQWHRDADKDPFAHLATEQEAGE